MLNPLEPVTVSEIACYNDLLLNYYRCLFFLFNCMANNPTLTDHFDRPQIAKLLLLGNVVKRPLREITGTIGEEQSFSIVSKNI